MAAPQTATPVPATPAEQATDPQPAGTEAGGDIVVTAQRRAESLRTVPIAISVVSGDALVNSKATQLSDIQQFAPSVQFTTTVQNPTYSIRGVGTVAYDYGVEQSVGFALDDVNITLPRLNPINILADVERVEVLRGPQGTLFGKNTTAGLISITTRKPQLGEYSNEGHVQVGSRGQVEVYDVINVPVSNTVAVRVRAGYQTQDDPSRNFSYGRLADTRNWMANGKLLWEPTERLSLYAIADYQDSFYNSNGQSVLKYGTGGNAPATGYIRNSLTSFGITPGPENRDVALDGDNFTHARTHGEQLTVSYDLGFANLTSVTAYRAEKWDGASDADNSARSVLNFNVAHIDAHQFSQELRLASAPGGTIDYVAGLFYYDRQVQSTQDQSGTFGYLPDTSTIRVASLGGLAVFGTGNKSYAGFAQGTLHATERLRFVLGGRYTHDDVSSSFNVDPLANVCGLVYVTSGGRTCTATALPTASIDRSNGHGDWTGRAGVELDVAPTVMAYFTASRGYKATALTNTNGFLFVARPETVKAFELGLKGDYFDRLLSLNLALYSNDFNDFQTQVYDATLGATGGFRVGNAGGLLAKGVEAEATLRPYRGLTFGGGVTYSHARYQSYFPPCYPVQTAATGCNLPGPTFDASGMPLVNAPDWTAVANGAYTATLGRDLKVYLNGDFSYRSSVLFGVGDPNTRQGGYSLVNASIGLGDVADHARVSFWVRNLFDQRYRSRIGQTVFDRGGYVQVIPDAAYRRIGASLDWRF
ncbi:MAG: TonB-dependent receptor [Sphingomonas adhaesiva]|uniref:TonB-dependent receptor n=1 Tax=Sphingomonas adhaesiva TaxID=28212 RepID=UPI002FF60946